MVSAFDGGEQIVLANVVVPIGVIQHEGHLSQRQLLGGYVVDLVGYSRAEEDLVYLIVELVEVLVVAEVEEGGDSSGDAAVVPFGEVLLQFLLGESQVVQTIDHLLLFARAADGFESALHTFSQLGPVSFQLVVFIGVDHQLPNFEHTLGFFVRQEGGVFVLGHDAGLPIFVILLAMVGVRVLRHLLVDDGLSAVQFQLAHQISGGRPHRGLPIDAGVFGFLDFIDVAGV